MKRMIAACGFLAFTLGPLGLLLMADGFTARSSQVVVGGFLLLGAIVFFVGAIVVAAIERQTQTRWGGRTECPSCAELIKLEATRCPYCRQSLDDPTRERLRWRGPVAGGVLLSIVLTGCVSLPPAAERVQVVHDVSRVTNCEALGPVARSDRVWGALPQARRNNENVLRGDTAALGGNTLLIRQEMFSMVEGPRTVGVAYRCAPPR